MNTNKNILIYIASTFFWNSFCLVLSLFYYKHFLLQILAGTLAGTLTIFSLYLLINISELSPYTKSYHVPVIATLTVAITEVFAWFLNQNWINPPKVLNVFLVSGVGLILITFISFFSHMLIKKTEAHH